MGTLLRLATCWGVPLHAIEPFGFVLSQARFRRSVMDYDFTPWLHIHTSWAHFSASTPGRYIGLVPKAPGIYTEFAFRPGDILIAGSESTGLPSQVICHLSHTVCIPMRPGMRSLNLAIACAIVLGHALHATQTPPFP